MRPTLAFGAAASTLLLGAFLCGAAASELCPADAAILANFALASFVRLAFKLSGNAD